MFHRIKLSKSFCWGILVSSFTWLVTIYLYLHVSSDNEATPSLPTMAPPTEPQERLIPYKLQNAGNIVDLKPNSSYVRTKKQEFLRLSNSAGKFLSYLNFISICIPKTTFTCSEGEDGPVFVVCQFFCAFYSVSIFYHRLQTVVRSIQTLVCDGGRFLLAVWSIFLELLLHRPLGSHPDQERPICPRSRLQAARFQWIRLQPDWTIPRSAGYKTQSVSIFFDFQILI